MFGVSFTPLGVVAGVSVHFVAAHRTVALEFGAACLLELLAPDGLLVMLLGVQPSMLERYASSLDMHRR